MDIFDGCTIDDPTSNKIYHLTVYSDGTWTIHISVGNVVDYSNVITNLNQLPSKMKSKVKVKRDKLLTELGTRLKSNLNG